MEIMLGHTKFGTKREALARVREILHTMPLDAALEGEELTLIWHLLLRHHDAEAKIGAGVHTISVRSPPGFRGQRCFWLHRLDGTGVDFSIHVAMRGRPDQRNDVLTAMRVAVDDQIKLLRSQTFATYADAHGRILCPISGSWVTESECDVDHHPAPFIGIATAFANRLGGWGAIHVMDGPGGFSGVLASDEVRLNWQEHHRQHAGLRVIARQAHQLQRGEPP